MKSFVQTIGRTKHIGEKIHRGYIYSVTRGENHCAMIINLCVLVGGNQEMDRPDNSFHDSLSMLPVLNIVKTNPAEKQFGVLCFGPR